MEPTLYTGDHILIDHPVLGSRIVNPFAALRGAEVKTRKRLNPPRIERNEIIVFNYPYADRREKICMSLNVYYVKRCLGLPGDTIEIRNGFYVINHRKGIVGNIEGQRRLAARSGESFSHYIYETFPHHPSIKWNIKEFGPLLIPVQNIRISLTPRNVYLYKTLIEWEQKQPLRIFNERVYLGAQEISDYCFQKNYYFVGGDHIEDSEDSRYWGFVPEEFIVGKALLILKSIDEKGNFRWERFLKKLR